MASRKIQATLSERSSARVEQIQETFKKLRNELSDSAAVNNLIELLCDTEADLGVESKALADAVRHVGRLKSKVSKLQSQLAFEGEK